MKSLITENGISNIEQNMCCTDFFKASLSALFSEKAATLWNNS